MLDLLSKEVASVYQIASTLARPQGEIAYHVSVLDELGCLSIVDRRPSGGSTEIFYIATPIASSERHWSKKAPYRNVHDFLEEL